MQRTRVQYFFLLVTIVFSLMLLGGCYTPAGRTAGEVVDDAAITTKIKAKLFDSESLSGLAISVKTFDRVVTLTGAVDNSLQKSQAEGIAWSVREVRRVNNLLEVKYP